MSGNPIYEYISSAAVSLTMAGNTGISPFLTLLLLGVIEMIKPEMLNMGDTMEMLLSSWWSIAVLGVLAIVEMVGKCIPAVDEVIDSAQVFVVPAISVLSTLATMGMLPGSDDYQEDAGLGQTINVTGMFAGGDGLRNLQEELDPDMDPNSFSEGFMTFTKVSLVIFGIGLALAVHLFKMLVRVSSLTCTGGCCHPFITVLEYVVVIVGVILAFLVPVFAIVACIVFMVAAGYVIRVKCCKKEESEASEGENAEKNGTNGNQTDLENQSTPEAAAERSEASPKPLADAFAAVVFEDVPLSSPMSQKEDVEAKVY